MKISEKWLREWADPGVDIQVIADRLVMAGLELEVEPAVAELASGVVVGHIVAVAPHPDAERLRVCEVDVGGGRRETIVCGASNARERLNVPCALPGARLPGGIAIGVSKLRGVESRGMLCSARELALSERSEGLLELDASAPAGMPIEQYLHLHDHILNLELTPNRGDCLSVLGLAREISALFGATARQPVVPEMVATVEDVRSVEVEDAAACTRFAGRLVIGLNPDARTPDWMRERLRRSGIRSIQPLVDITHYVMLELGQPMHAYDAHKLGGTVRVRRARTGEKLTLLNEQTIELSDELVIADEHGPVGLAGVMGGAATAVSAGTTATFLESACFTMDAVAGVGRRHKLSSDAAYRFERGVDPALQRTALERATELVLQICGGHAGPVSETGGKAQRAPIALRKARLDRVLGYEIPDAEVEAVLTRLSIAVAPLADGVWTVSPPSFRHDLAIEADLIEEVARLYGYDRIPVRPYCAALAPTRPLESERSPMRTRDLLAARGWQEIVSLSFADPAVQAQLDGGVEAVALDNPLAEQLAVMRTSLWSGLLRAWTYNRARQQPRAKLFELGVCFMRQGGAIVEVPRIAGLAAGSVRPEQWGEPVRAIDFYDVKGDLEALFATSAASLSAVAEAHPALHPGRSARLRVDGRACGWLGQLHPAQARLFDLSEAPILFEIDWSALAQLRVPRAESLSEFPSSRRDLALLLPDDVTSQAVCEVARSAAGELLRRVWVFDVYRGANLPDGLKSVALGLIFQDYSRTLTVEEIDAAMAAIGESLKTQLGASDRS